MKAKEVKLFLYRYTDQIYQEDEGRVSTRCPRLRPSNDFRDKAIMIARGDTTTACVAGLKSVFGVTLPEFGKYTSVTVAIKAVGTARKAYPIS
jgi:hypothetical protein